MALDHFKNYILGQKLFSILTDLIGAPEDDKYTKIAHSRLTRWADKLLPYGFTVEHLPGKEMRFVDYLSEHKSGDPVPVSYDDENFVIASVIQISLLLGCENLMLRYSRSQRSDKFSQQTVSHDLKYCNVVGQSTNKLVRQESEHEKRIETLQFLFAHSNFSECRNLYSRTEDCIPSCQRFDFLDNYKVH